MFKDIVHYTVNSINSKLLFLFLLVLCPIVGVSLYNNSLSQSLMLAQYTTSHQNLLDTWSQQFGTQLDSAASYATNLAYYENDPQILTRSTSDAAIEYAYQRILASFKEQLQTSYLINGFFLMAVQQDGYTPFLTKSNYDNSSGFQTLLENYVTEQIAADTVTATWELCTIGTGTYLFYMTGTETEDLYAGAWAEVTQLLNNVTGDVFSDSTILLTDSSVSSMAEGESISNESILITSAITATLSLQESFSRNLMYNSLPLMQRYPYLIAILIVLLIAILLFTTFRLISFPLLRISGVMHYISKGETDRRIQGKEASTELDIIHNTFNRTMDELQQTKIQSYEDQLWVQKAQLRNLQLQIKPHFLINSLNMIYNMVELGTLDQAKKLIHYTVDYFRYMTRVDEDMVPLNEELEHVKVYLELQSIRYSRHFTYDFQVDPMVADMLVPPILLQSFAENSVKYALDMDSEEPLHITLQVSSFEKEYFPYARITMRDSGAGYPGDILDQLNQGHRIVRADGEHIGMYNCTNRLRILFGEKAAWKFYNDCGAVFELIIPAAFSEETDV